VSSQARPERPADDPTRETPSYPDMVWLPGGTYRMGSDKHYREEAPAHHVAVSSFWIDRTPRPIEDLSFVGSIVGS
jgi:formylglycine-generating enzyme required for sulfatase activity